MEDIYKCYCGEDATYFARIIYQYDHPTDYTGRCSRHVNYLLNTHNKVDFVDTAEELLLLAIEDKL